MSIAIPAKTISPRLAHVAQKSDLLAQSVTPLAQANTYSSAVTVPPDASAFQLFQEASHQIVRAICHLFEGVPADHGIAIYETDIALRSAMRTDMPVEAWIFLTLERNNPRHILWQCNSTINFFQGQIRVAEARIRSMTLPRTVGDPTLRWPHASFNTLAA
jgi:hypothetical protein